MGNDRGIVFIAGNGKRGSIGLKKILTRCVDINDVWDICVHIYKWGLYTLNICIREKSLRSRALEETLRSALDVFLFHDVRCLKRGHDKPFE